MFVRAIELPDQIDSGNRTKHVIDDYRFISTSDIKEFYVYPKVDIEMPDQIDSGNRTKHIIASEMKESYTHYKVRIEIPNQIDSENCIACLYTR